MLKAPSPLAAGMAGRLPGLRDGLRFFFAINPMLDVGGDHLAAQARIVAGLRLATVPRRVTHELSG